MRFTRAGMALLGAAIAGGGLAACSSSPSAKAGGHHQRSTATTAVHGPTTTAPPPTSTSGATTSTAASSTTSTITGDPACTKSALSVKQDGAAVAGPANYLGFTVFNDGSASCTIEGYPAIGLVDGKGGRPAVDHGQPSKGATFGDLSSPVTLAAGSAPGAAFVLEYSQLGANGAACYTSKGISVTLPGPAGRFRERMPRFDPCGTISVSAIVPVSEYDSQFPHHSG